MVESFEPIDFESNFDKEFESANLVSFDDSTDEEYEELEEGFDEDEDEDDGEYEMDYDDGADLFPNGDEEEFLEDSIDNSGDE